MANKIIISILVVIMILMGGIGYYSYLLNQQVDYLGEQLTGFKMEQTTRINDISSELATLRTKTRDSLGNLGDKIRETQAEIDTLEGEMGITQDKLTGLKDEIDVAASQVDTLEDRLSEAVTGFSRSVMNASEVYETVSRATVSISNGQKSIFGSGFIFDNDFHVMTNYHVIENITQVYVTLHDGRVFRATKIGFNDISDIAVLEINSNPNIEPLTLADSSQVRIGEPVAVIGDPFGLRDTLNTGIISQTNRFVEVPNLLQFDAPVNPGNSGGPLVNAGGEVIGVVVSRIPPGEGDGIYYAISSNKAKRVAAGIIARGYFDYPWIGIGIAEISPQAAEDRGMETRNGVLVSGIFTDGPAEAAGMKTGDIILAINDVTINNAAELTSYLGEFTSPGDTAKIRLIRGGTELELTMEIGKRP